MIGMALSAAKWEAHVLSAMSGTHSANLAGTTQVASQPGGSAEARIGVESHAVSPVRSALTSISGIRSANRHPKHLLPPPPPPQ
mmetsp:Transcript_58916/g.140623  ORF Transcript_58916/g.140623 Transcript_58916/m.140623 type:complete len:84 (+) Transcript_58916:313-564(+)